ncbi:Hypothetical predicted protein [Paramuricea clavata]|uniref:Uncharacterized protein n=1 Tax=Paramuricea clavata TaxID=317549 RepID=A0A6S7G0Y9_PARCT|nr:Hypothetical predicted protein [Paramuricea clavata]
MVRELPDAYRNVPPAVLKDKGLVVPKLIGPVMPPTQDQDAITRNINWLENVKSLYGKDKLDKEEFVSWAAFHAATSKPRSNTSNSNGSTTFCDSKTDTVEQFQYTWRRSLCGHVWWFAHRNGSNEMHRRVVEWEWLGNCTS